jgi:hypothetical protein
VFSEKSQIFLWHSKLYLNYKACSKNHSSEQNSGIIQPQQFLSQHDAPATWTNGLGFDSICWIGLLIISSRHQFVFNEGSQILLWHLKLHFVRHVLRAILVSRVATLLNLNIFYITSIIFYYYSNKKKTTKQNIFTL